MQPHTIIWSFQLATVSISEETNKQQKQSRSSSDSELTQSPDRNNAFSNLGRYDDSSRIINVLHKCLYSFRKSNM